MKFKLYKTNSESLKRFIFILLITVALSNVIILEKIDFQTNSDTLSSSISIIDDLELSATQSEEFPKVNQKPASGSNHAPIHIDGDNNFTTDNGVISGSGTVKDPYIIANWIIDAQYIGPSITIAYTTSHFVIENCTLFNAGGDYLEGNIEFDHVTNGQIINNTIRDGTTSGIRSKSSTMCDIRENKITNQSGYGIFLDPDCHNTTIHRNIISDLPTAGIGIQDSVNIIITGNIVKDNTNVNPGIFLYNCDNSVIFGNLIENYKRGFACSYSSYLVFSGNTISNCENEGISVSYGNSNIISGNKIDGNIYLGGMELLSTNSNEITGNIISNTAGDAINLASSSSNYICNNWIWNNVDNITGSSGNYVYDNYYFPISDLHDSDGDGLSDTEELLLGTSPRVVDTDSDNALDPYEINSGTDPLDDTDYPEIWKEDFNLLMTYLDGNATLVNTLIEWSDSNATLLDYILVQLQENATYIQQVSTWLVENVSRIDHLFTQLDGNATLLTQIMNNLNDNTTLIDQLITQVNNNATLLTQVVTQLEENATRIQQVVTWLADNSTQIKRLFSYLKGNVTLLTQVMTQLEGNATLVQTVLALATHNRELLTQLNGTYIADINRLKTTIEQLKITIGDLDCDGLSDLEEMEYGTNLSLMDTDCDNLNDAFEIKIGTDPLDDDSDDDEYLDGIELLNGTDPLDHSDYPGAINKSDTQTPNSPFQNIGFLIAFTVLLAILSAGIILFIRRRKQ